MELLKDDYSNRIGKYYLVQMRCGHVGYNRYIPIWFPIIAYDKYHAMKLAIKIPRVKNHSIQDIISIKEVTKKEWQNQILINKEDIYLKCTYKDENIDSLIKNRIVNEYVNYFYGESTKIAERKIFKRKSKRSIENKNKALFKLKKQKVLSKYDYLKDY